MSKVDKVYKVSLLLSDCTYAPNGNIVLLNEVTKPVFVSKKVFFFFLGNIIAHNCHYSVADICQL